MSYAIIAWNFTRKKFEITKDDFYSLNHAINYMAKVPPRKKPCIAPEEFAREVLGQRIIHKLGGSYKEIYTYDDFPDDDGDDIPKTATFEDPDVDDVPEINDSDAFELFNTSYPAVPFNGGQFVKDDNLIIGLKAVAYNVTWVTTAFGHTTQHSGNAIYLILTG